MSRETLAEQVEFLFNTFVIDVFDRGAKRPAFFLCGFAPFRCLSSLDQSSHVFHGASFMSSRASSKCRLCGVKAPRSRLGVTVALWFVPITRTAMMRNTRLKLQKILHETTPEDVARWFNANGEGDLVSPNDVEYEEVLRRATVALERARLLVENGQRALAVIYLTIGMCMNSTILAGSRLSLAALAYADGVMNDVCVPLRFAEDLAPALETGFDFLAFAPMAEDREHAELAGRALLARRLLAALGRTDARLPRDADACADILAAACRYAVPERVIVRAIESATELRLGKDLRATTSWCLDVSARVFGNETGDAIRKGLDRLCVRDPQRWASLRCTQDQLANQLAARAPELLRRNRR